MSGCSRPRPLSASDEVTSFAWGEPTLDDFLSQRAVASQDSGAARTCVSVSVGQIAACYTVAVATVERAGTPSARYRKNQPNPIPAVLLARLAIDRRHQHRGLGRSMLLDALSRSLQVSEQVGVRLVLVHASPQQVREFYLRHGFEPSPVNELHLMILMKDVRGLL